MATDINIENLPAYEQISCKPIRDSAAAYNAAKAAHDQARKDVVELEQTRPQSEWRDAAATEKARAERKPDPKRSYVVAHDKKIDTAKHEVKVTHLAVERAERDLIGSLERNGPAWIEEVEIACSALAEQWATEIAELTATHAKLREAFGVRGAVIGAKGQPRIAVVEFEVGQVQGREWASHQPSSIRPQVSTGDILAALSTVGMLEPEREPIKHPPPPRGRSPLEDMGAVQQEIAEREQVEAQAEATRATQNA